MDLRNTVRRTRAVAAVYFSAYIDALIAYRSHDVGSVGHKRALETQAMYRDAVDQIATEISAWITYPTLREKYITIGAALAESGEGLKDGRDEWRKIVGADLDARIADPKGTRKIPLPRP
jgi:hypothetical protein